MISTRGASLPGGLRQAASRLSTRPVAFVGVVALAARLTVALVSFLVHDPVLIPDEGQYINLASHVASGRGAEAWATGYGQSLYDTTWAFSGPLALLFNFFWPSRLLAQLWVVPFGVLTAIAVVLIAGRVVSRGWAVVAGLVVALLPSQVLWSSVVLREAHIWASLAAVGVAVATANRVGGRRFLVAVGVAVVALLALSRLREHTMVAAAWALVPGVAVGAARQRALRTVGALALAVMLPLIAGLGPAGWDLVERAVPSLAMTRTQLGVGAETSFIEPEVQQRSAKPGTDAAQPRHQHAEPPREGSTQRFQAQDGTVYAIDEGVTANVRHLPNGVVAVLLRPFLWEDSTSTGARLARFENMVWIALYAFALFGVGIGWRCRSVLAYPFFVTGAVLGIAFLTQGNLGTAFRHRGQVLWAVAIFAVVGAEWMHRRPGATAARDSTGRTTTGGAVDRLDRSPKQ